MKRALVATALLVSLAGCNESPDSAGSAQVSHGRYLGIGVYNAGALWSRIKVAASADKAAARLADDDHVIVVVDSQTGEVRQCGNTSGYCVRANPWVGDVSTLPAGLTAHVEDLTSNISADEIANTSNGTVAKGEDAH